MSPMRIPLFLLAHFTLLSAPVVAQCGSAGVAGIPRISFSGKAVDRTVEFRVDDGHPGSDWVCFFDVNPGPTPTPFGALCVGPTAVDIFNSFTGTAPLLDATGAVRIPVFLPPALGAFEGMPFYLQAVIADPTTSAGISISENHTQSFRRPRLFVGGAVIGPDYFTSIDPSTAASDFTNSYSDSIRSILPIPSANLVAVIENGDRFWLLDDETGATVFHTTQVAISDMVLGRDGRTLVLHEPGILFQPGSIRTLDIFTLARQNFPLTVFPGDIFAHPDQDVVYLTSNGQVARLNYMTGAVLPPIPAGLPTGSPAIFSHDPNSPTLHVIAEGFAVPIFPGNVLGQVAAIDLPTDSLLATSAPFPFTDIPLRRSFTAVGTNGPGLFVPVNGFVRELDPVTLLFRRVILQPGSVSLSAGGTELLFVDDVRLSRFDLATDTATVLATTTMANSDIATAPGRAYYVDDNSLYGFDSDPATAPTLIASLPGMPFNIVKFSLLSE